MNQLGKDFRAYVASTNIPGCTVTQEDEDHITFSTQKATGGVTFYAFEGIPEIVELRICDVDQPDEPTFFLHFELEDEKRAEELFLQMVEALTQQDQFDTRRVLLCCTAGMTTSMF
ncbi:MAG: hypothetical protein Q4A07_13180, partial [Coriobacteriales bacterium]|nr:hypothetical protein [Coriobacteriales bacterium]